MDAIPAASDAFIAHGTPAFWRANLALFASGFATLALLYCVQPLLPVLSAAFGVGAAASSLSLSLTTVLLAACMPVAGALSEVHGRKGVMVGSLLASAALTVACALAPNWGTLLLLRAAMGITLSGLPAVAMAYVGEEMHPRSLGLAMGLYVGGNGIGGMAGRMLTGIVTDLRGWRAAMAAIGVLAALAGLVLWRALPPSRHFTPRELRLRATLHAFAQHGRDPALRLLFAEGFLLMGAFVTVYNYVGYRLLAPPFSLSQASIGLVFAVYLLGTASSTATGSLTGRLGRAPLLLGGIATMLAGTLLTLATALPLVVAGIALLTIGFFGAHAIASAWIGARATHAKAQAASLYLFAYYLGSSVVGSAGGLAWSARGWGAVVGMTGALLVVAGLLGVRLAGGDRRVGS